MAICVNCLHGNAATCFWLVFCFVLFLVLVEGELFLAIPVEEYGGALGADGSMGGFSLSPKPLIGIKLMSLMYVKVIQGL